MLRRSFGAVLALPLVAASCLLLALLLTHPRVAADPPAALQDSGNCSLDPSQNRIIRSRTGKIYELRSFFEPGDRFALNRISVEDLRALSAEVTRLQGSRCYEVCVRSLVTGAGLNQSAANCDSVFIVAHGSKEFPYMTPGGRTSVQLTSGPGSIRATSIWIGGCFAQNAVRNLNGRSGQRYKTMPKDRFETDGTAGRNTMIRELTAELARLHDTQCELPKRVCIVSGVQEIVGQ